MKPSQPLRCGREPPRRERWPLQAIAASFFWTWALALLMTRHHLVGNYRVVQAAPWLWGPVVLPAALLLLVALLGGLMARLCLQHCRANHEPFPRPIRWLLVSALVPALDLLRMLEISVPLTFIEPLAIVGITMLAVGEMIAVLPESPRWERLAALLPWSAMTWIAAILMGIFWHSQSVRAYDNFLLGFNDFGHFGQRVANTWAGRGFLMETPSLPAFWDHFNPGLALLAPLWGLWPDPKLFMLVQAVCLLLSAPLVYAIARELGATKPESAMWALALLVYPPLGQLNLAFSYGWHPVSLALPLLFLVLLFLLQGRFLGALISALLACSFREDVVVALGCLAAAMALERGWTRWRGQDQLSARSQASIVADKLPIGAWLAINVMLIVAFLLIYAFAGFREFQVSRFTALGDSGLEIAFSPLLRPAVFWGAFLHWEPACFVSALLLPLGLGALFRGRWIVLACALPLTVLIAWGHHPAISIAFQYTTTLLPILFLAAMVGAASGEGGAKEAVVAGPMWRATVIALVGCATASLWLGATPWCRNTLTDVLGKTYAEVRLDQLEDRLPGSEGIRALHDTVAMLKRNKALSVLASGRIAAHLVGIERLDTIGQAPRRWAAFQREAGPGRSGLELFDWIVVDTCERFQQSDEDIAFVLEEAERAGYRIVGGRRGIIILTRPQN